jgi:hypothetical protein
MATHREGRIINAAYALVQSVYGDDIHNPTSNAGHRAWERHEVQAAAMKAARAFLETVDPEPAKKIS